MAGMASVPKQAVVREEVYFLLLELLPEMEQSVPMEEYMEETWVVEVEEEELWFTILQIAGAEIH